MAHPAQFEFFSALRDELPQFFSNVKIGEFGSLDINGTIRHLFEGCEYVGIDIGEGPGVDLVCPGQQVSFPSGYFDVTASAECFEHNPFWIETFANMLRLTRPGGLVALSVATTGREEHGTPRTSSVHSPLTAALGDGKGEYYRNLTDKDILSSANLEGWFSGFQFLLCPSAQDLYFWGVLRSSRLTEALPQEEIDFRSHVFSMNDTLAKANGTITLSHFTDEVGFLPRGVRP